MQVTGERGRSNMEKKIKYSDEPMEFRAVKDFLPSPEDLILKEENVKVTLTLSKDSIIFFKQWASTRKNAHYQTMIRNILDHYVSCHKPVPRENNNEVSFYKVNRKLKKIPGKMAKK